MTWAAFNHFGILLDNALNAIPPGFFGSECRKFANEAHDEFLSLYADYEIIISGKRLKET
jgi:hypothetical protein